VLSLDGNVPGTSRRSPTPEPRSRCVSARRSRSTAAGVTTPRARRSRRPGNSLDPGGKPRRARGTDTLIPPSSRTRRHLPAAARRRGPAGALASAMVTITASATVRRWPSSARAGHHQGTAEPPFGRPYWYQCGSKEITQRATARLGERIGSLVDVFRPEAGTATWLYYQKYPPQRCDLLGGTIRQGCNLGVGS